MCAKLEFGKIVEVLNSCALDTEAYVEAIRKREPFNYCNSFYGFKFMNAFVLVSESVIIGILIDDIGYFTSMPITPVSRMQRSTAMSIVGKENVRYVDNFERFSISHFLAPEQDRPVN